ncbi:hypothetical protein T484DRAFT_1976974 [Baffinella frigidus]|nr:hypothetical protein T484DRAFT_1976974 [Cryptophyta sp. CCMP2293]
MEDAAAQDGRRRRRPSLELARGSSGALESPLAGNGNRARRGSILGDSTHLSFKGSRKGSGTGLGETRRGSFVGDSTLPHEITGASAPPARRKSVVPAGSFRRPSLALPGMVKASTRITLTALSR